MSANKGAVQALPEYVSAPDRLRLLKMVMRAIKFNPSRLLSKEYSFGNDNLSFESRYISNAYALSQNLLEEGIVPPKAIMQDIIFLKMAAHAKGTHEGSGAKRVIAVYTSPQNKPFIDEKKVGRLIKKVLEGLQEGFVEGHMLSSDCVSYCFRLVDSPLGRLVEDSPVLKPYVKLRDFLSQ